MIESVFILTRFENSRFESTGCIGHSGKKRKVRCVVPDDISAVDACILGKFYVATEGDSWLDNTNWLTEQNADDWFGVTVYAGQRIYSIALQNNQLAGYIPPELGRLESAFYILTLTSNQITGTIPAELCQLTSLGYLSLNGNLLNGTIPPEISQLSGLRKLRLSDNSLSGEIPSGVCLSSSLTELLLQGNLFTSAEMSSFVINELWTNRAVLGANGCTINIATTDALSADASDAIAGTDNGGSGLYTGDGLQQAGCTVTWTA